MDLIRVMVLICCCLLTLGSYYSYDLPGSMPDEFRENLGQNDTVKSGLFYSVYSLPNSVQPFFGGLIIDRYLGLRKGAIICCSLVCFGNILLVVSSYWAGTSTAFVLALSGRFIFGLGGETLSVTQNGFVAKWFRGSDLATAFAIVLSFARVGSAVNFAVEPSISDKFGFSFALWVSVGFCLCSVSACLLLMYIDAKYEGMTKVENNEQLENENGDSLESPLINSNSQTEGTQAEVVHPSIFHSMLSVLGRREILIYLICVLFYVPVFIFLGNVAVKILVDSYPQVDKAKAGLYCSIPYTVSAVVSPFLGFAMDKIGRGLLFVGLACASLVSFHIVFALIPGEVNPSILMVWLGITYSTCAASLWPLVSLVVESRSISTAYGLMMSIQNTGLAIGPLLVTQWLPDYKKVELFFVYCGLGALGCSYLLFWYDEDGVLSSKGADFDAVSSPSVSVNPLNPRATPFLRGSRFVPSDDTRRAIAPKTPNAVRQAYFRRLRIQSHI